MTLDHRNRPKQRLSIISEALLDADAPIWKQRENLQDYMALLESVCQIDYSGTQLHPEDIVLEQGVALNPNMAALCVNDIRRSHHFINGLDAAVQAAMPIFPNEPLRIIYAGTGPFATLALPIMSRYTTEQVQFTCLEVNPDTMKMVKEVISKLDLEDYVETFIEADACQLELDDTYHILISETMQYALVKEPQVSIMANLERFVHPNGFLLPASIKVDLALFNSKLYGQKALDADADISDGDITETLSTLMDVDRVFVASIANGGTFPKLETTLPAYAHNRFNQLVLMTTIKVFGEHTIRPWESSLTIPYILRRWDTFNPYVSLQYKISNSPTYIVGEMEGDEGQAY